jgi:hypothetical protein
MRAEREYLRTCVFPELDERLRPRHHHLEPIDLRWGVEAQSPDEERSQELATLKVALAEIDRSRPLQIVLIGDRYGCVPPEARAQAVVEEVGFQTEVAGKSVAALEIEFGLSGDPEQARQCFFYFREPLDYDRMPDDVAADYCSPCDTEQLAELKQRIEREMPDRVRHYRAEWDEENQVVTGLDGWGRTVLEDLWQALDDQTRAYVESPPPTWQDEQRWLLERFVEARGEGFVGRAGVADRLLRLARSPAGRGQPWAACVTGGGGAGKSALFAYLHRQLQQEDVLLLAHAAGVGARSIQVDTMLRRWVSELAQAMRVDDSIDDTSTSQQLQQAFAELLGRASAERRVVLLVDGLNQLEPTQRAQHLNWLPENWPKPSKGGRECNRCRCRFWMPRRPARSPKRSAGGITASWSRRSGTCWSRNGCPRARRPSAVPYGWNWPWRS